MVENITLELSLNELKLLLVTLDSFQHQLKNKSTRSDALLQIHKSEEFFNFDFDVVPLINDLPKFLNEVIGFGCDKFYDAYFELASNLDKLKPLPPEDDRYSVSEMFSFLELDVPNHLGAN